MGNHNSVTVGFSMFLQYYTGAVGRNHRSGHDTDAAVFRQAAGKRFAGGSFACYLPTAAGSSSGGQRVAVHGGHVGGGNV